VTFRTAVKKLSGKDKFGRVFKTNTFIVSVDAKYNSSFTPLRNYSISITRDHHRFIHYSFPKDDYEKFEFYELVSDPNELKDLYPAKPSLALEMQNELRQKVEEVNKPYRTGIAVIEANVGEYDHDLPQFSFDSQRISQDDSW